MSKYIPKVGEKCEVLPYFHACVAVCEYGGDLLMHDLHENAYFKAGSNNFRPLKTKQDIEREEAIEKLALMIDAHTTTLSMNHLTIKHIAKDIYEAGYHDGPKVGEKTTIGQSSDEWKKDSTASQEFSVWLFEHFDIFRKVES